MRALFDVNFLIAIVDSDHEHHAEAHGWWAKNISSGWATCPLTENGMVRIMSQSRYKSPISATFAIDLLSEQIDRTDHERRARRFGRSFAGFVVRLIARRDGQPVHLF